jgi:ABC-type nitrate/sulfonate/bicarbonate transport system ATPase subunit
VAPMTLELHIHGKAFAAKTVLQDFKLSIAEGEICAVVGVCGVGKSTILAIAAGLDTAYSGHVSARRNPLGMVFQTPRLLPWRTVRENLALVLPGREERATAWLASVGLEGHEDVYPGELSLDAARRVAVARALAVEPRLLLLDEPFAGLEPDNALRMRDLLADYLRAARPTTLLVTRQIGDATAFADRVISLSGSPARVLRDARLTAADDDDAPPAPRRSTVVDGRGEAAE